MSNERKDFEIKIHCNEAFYRALVLMLRHAEGLCCGMSRNLIIYFDGDGSDFVKVLSLSEEVAKSDKGSQKNGSFYIDTDEVFKSISG